MSTAAFEKAVSAWVKKAPQRILAVRNEAVQDMVDAMQTTVHAGGNLPLISGFLRASLVAASGDVTIKTVEKPAGDRPYTWAGDDLALVLVRTPITESITIGYAANYAVYAEYGSHGRPGRGFMGLALQRWPQFVAAAGARAAKAAGGPTR